MANTFNAFLKDKMDYSKQAQLYCTQIKCCEWDRTAGSTTTYPTKVERPVYNSAQRFLEL
jgi:hypothetical protein